MTTGSGRPGGMTGIMDRLSERDALDRLIGVVRDGESRALVVRGDPGVGKSVLLDHLAGRASDVGCRVARVMGVQSEMELAFAGLHQLCAPMFDHVGRIPVPQREALRTAFGLSAGPAPDRFFVGLAVLSLLSEVAGERPLIGVIDDEQWLDQASAQALGFVARRLGADQVGLVFAAREPSTELAGLPELVVEGLQDDDARALLDSALAGPLDERVRDLIVAETRGNPLALLELPRGLTPAELAGGFGLPGAAPLTGRIEESFARQLGALPDQTRRLVQLASADPSGNRSLVWRAAGRLYREAIDQLSGTRLRPELARAHLLYGEWLRRRSLRVEARGQLRTAHVMLDAIGMEAFAERARRELLATGQKARKRSAETRDQLTPQEEQIARLARDGLSNPEIGAQLFLSVRTVEWHLRKVYTKLGIGSRHELKAALAQPGQDASRPGPGLSGRRSDRRRYSEPRR